MNIKEMKRMLVLGVFTLFIACNSASEKSSNADSTALIQMDTTAVNATVTEVIDTASAVQASDTKVSEVKVKEAPVVKEVKSAEPALVEQKVDNKKGETLISKSDCFACHKVNEKLLGPSYKEVANKYPNTKANIDYLVNKIKLGGSGVWGAIPMSPHPALSDDDAEAMVQYILSLK